MENKEKKEKDWEKLAVYVTLFVSLITGLVYLADMKERIRALEVEIVNIKDK